MEPQQAKSSEAADRDPSCGLSGCWVGVDCRPILEDSFSISLEQRLGELQGHCRDGSFGELRTSGVTNKSPCCCMSH